MAYTDYKISQVVKGKDVMLLVRVYEGEYVKVKREDPETGKVVEVVEYHRTKLLREYGERYSLLTSVASIVKTANTILASDKTRTPISEQVAKSASA
jgi:nitrate reductase NapAB chaperone NapD